MESYYEFNVAWEGKHYFATAPRSFPNTRKDKAMQFYKDLCERFPEIEGFSVTVVEWECVGRHRTLDSIKEGL